MLFQLEARPGRCRRHGMPKGAYPLGGVDHAHQRRLGADVQQLLDPRRVFDGWADDRLGGVVVPVIEVRRKPVYASYPERN